MPADGVTSSAALAQPTRTTGFLRQYELVEKVLAYHPDADERALDAAYVYAVQKHGEQKRASGDPYFAHPVAVAGLLADLRLDETTIIAGLLHDTVEDTDAHFAEIYDLFGAQVVEIVDGVTKLEKLEYHSEETRQAENFQKLILATIQDVRVLIVKLADRLHNMRTLHFLKKPEKRARIARETLEIYGPLARRIGLSVYASEMEDLGFAELYPDARAAIRMRLDEMQAARDDDLDAIEAELKRIVAEAGVQARVIGRRKSPYSIWRKLERKNISFSDIADIFAFRVITNDADSCYRVMGRVHQIWPTVPDRFRDFISVPKPNGYRSLHTTVRGTGNRTVEIQLRTEEMHATAERGVAAHWRYKNASYGFDAEAARDAGINTSVSLNTFAEIMEEGADPAEYLENAKLEMYRDSVFTFTPNGRLIVLPAGAMPLDFAYAVHTEIGNTAVGARINGETRPLRTVLRNGDVVEILRRERHGPVNGHQALTLTAKARAAQRRLARERDTVAFRQLGKGLVDRALRARDIEPVELDIGLVANKLAFEDVEPLYEAVGRGQLKLARILETAFPGLSEPPHEGSEPVRLTADIAELVISGVGLAADTVITLARCCSPVPGDRILGIAAPGGGLDVHTIDCPSLASHDDDPEAWVDLTWTALAQDGVVAVSRIRVTAINKKGVLAGLCAAIAQANGNIVGLRTHGEARDFIDLDFEIEVEDVKRVTQILAALRSLAVVDRAERLQTAETDDDT